MISSASIVGYVAVSLTMPAAVVALDVVDVGLVERPGVDLTLRAGLLVVDRPAVEAERLGEAVVVAGGQPCLLGGLQRLLGRVGDEGLEGRGQLGRRGERCLVGGVDAGGVVLDRFLLVVGRRSVVVAAAGHGEQRRRRR